MTENGQTADPHLVAAPSGPLVIPAMNGQGGRVPRLSLVIPTYNEAGNVRTLIERLDELLGAELGDGLEARLYFEYLVHLVRLRWTTLPALLLPRRRAGERLGPEGP